MQLVVWNYHCIMANIASHKAHTYISTFNVIRNRKGAYIFSNISSGSLLLLIVSEELLKEISIKEKIKS